MEFMCRRHDKTEHQAFWSQPGSGASPVQLVGRGGSAPGRQLLESDSCVLLQESLAHAQLSSLREDELFLLTFSMESMCLPENGAKKTSLGQEGPLSPSHNKVTQPYVTTDKLRSFLRSPI